ALVRRERNVTVAQDQSWHASAVEFLTQPPREGQGDIFFSQLVGQGRSSLVASMAGIDDRKVSRRSYWRGGRHLGHILRSQGCLWWQRRYGRHLRDRRNRDRLSFIAETCGQRRCAAHDQFRSTIAFLVGRRRNGFVVEGQCL